ncbi:hypothetical protein EVB91_111 [Rhizobium phage RHph_I1_18]|nr:hypothetical protein EVB91_111 [Rhizobium phage RHph_I1_18]
MWAFILPFLKKIELKWVAIIVATLVFALVCWKLYRIVLDNGVKDGIIATQKITLEHQSRLIDSMEKIAKLNDKIVEDRDKKIDQLNQQMEGLTDNLGEGADDLAPQSLRNFLERIK